MSRKGYVIEAIDDTPPVLDLRPEDIEAITEELVEYHSAFAGLYYRSKLPPPEAAALALHLEGAV